jgi:NADH-quinone oxidoreductase subunit G
VLANLLGMPGFDFDSTEDIRRDISGIDSGWVAPKLLGNGTCVAVDATRRAGVPAVAAIYALDGIVRRASSLQMTADAKAQSLAVEVTA